MTHHTAFNRDRGKHLMRSAIIYLVLAAGALAMLFPVYWMYMASFKDEFYSTGEHMVWFPPPWEAKYFTLDHYRELLSRTGSKTSGGTDNFIDATVNTAIMTGVGTLGNILFCAMAGFALAKLKFRGRNFILMAVVSTMMIPGIMLLLPNFAITTFVLHGYNNFAGLIIPGLAGPFGIFLMRQYMLSIPDELLDAAKVDGAGIVRIFFSIVLPLSTPIIVAYGILLVLGFWNELIWPMVITKDLVVLQMALQNLVEIGSQRMGPAMAGAAISSTPVIILFLIVRKQFVRAMTSGALKG